MDCFSIYSHLFFSLHFRGLKKVSFIYTNKDLYLTDFLLNNNFNSRIYIYDAFIHVYVYIWITLFFCYCKQDIFFYVSSNQLSTERCSFLHNKLVLSHLPELLLFVTIFQLIHRTKHVIHNIIISSANYKHQFNLVLSTFQCFHFLSLALYLASAFKTMLKNSYRHSRLHSFWLCMASSASLSTTTLHVG